MTLLGVKPANDELYQIKLNPGPDYILNNDDICYYISTSEETNTSFLVKSDKTNSNPSLVSRLTKGSLFKKNNNKLYDSAKDRKKLLETLSK